MILSDKNYIINMLQRVLLHAVNKRHCSSVLKTPNDDLGTKRKHLAKAIKKLNKENKSLFGSLLETLPEKRKRQKEERKTSQSNAEMLKESQTGKSEEAWWLSKMSSSKLVSSVSKPNTDYFTYSGKINQCNATKANGIGDITENLYSEKSSPEKCKISNTVPESEVVVTESVVEKAAVIKERKDRCNNFILPEVIVRNIPTFPLLNEVKTKKTIANKERNIPPTDTDDKRGMLMYPSVTKVLNATMPESSLAALKRWRLKMIAELGEEGFQTHYRAVLDAGALFHGTIQSYLAGTPQKVDPQIEGCWESLEAVLPNISNVKLLESHIVHSNLLYRGVIDCVAQYKKSTLLIEWKKSDKQKPELEKTYDAPVQVSAYMGAVNYDLKYEFQVEGGLVVVAYTDGSPAHIFPMSMSDCQKYWSFWLKRLQQYWLLQNSSDS